MIKRLKHELNVINIYICVCVIFRLYLTENTMRPDYIEPCFNDF
jgi:hypothetical protein